MNPPGLQPLSLLTCAWAWTCVTVNDVPTCVVGHVRGSLTWTPITIDSPTPADVMHSIEVVSIHVVFLQAVTPIDASGLRFLWPKFLPEIVSVAPDDVGALPGRIDETTGAP